MGVSKISYLDLEFENGEKLLEYDIVIINNGDFST